MNWLVDNSVSVGNFAAKMAQKTAENPTEKSQNPKLYDTKFLIHGFIRYCLILGYTKFEHKKMIWIT